jgi:hypothetical protein
MLVPILLIEQTGCFSRSNLTPSVEGAPGASGDTLALVPGGGGAISATPGLTSVSLSWAPAVDNETALAELSYLVVYSTTSALDSLQEVDANGTPAGTYQNNLTNLVVTGLVTAQAYTFTVVVRDNEGNRALYQATSLSTLSDTEAPVPGGGALLTTSNITGSSVSLSWAAATDNLTPQSGLLYLAYYSTTTPLTMLADVNAYGIPFGVYQTGISTIQVSGLV